MPGKPQHNDPQDLVRCNLENLASTMWWKSHNLDLVVLYAWGDPKYRAIAEAIRKAGIKLIQSLDTAGLHTPYGNLNAWWKCFSGMIAAPQPLSSRTRLLAKALRDFLPSLFERKRLMMMEMCDHLAAVSPPAADFIVDYARTLGHEGILSKMIVMPHPVSSSMQPSGVKLPKVLVVGRWRNSDRAQKDPEMTLAVIEGFLKSKPDWIAEVVGAGSAELDIHLQGWPPSCRNRLTLTEAVPRGELVKRYQESRILLCASRYESFHISSAEALCCGCSVVVADHPLLASTAWFSTRESGTIAANRDIDSFVAALLQETDLWESNKRIPDRIAENWIPFLYTENVALNILSNVRQNQNAQM